MKTRYILLVLGVVSCCAASAGCEWSDEIINIEKEDSFIVPLDMLAPEGEQVALEARLEYIDGLSGIRGETLEFVYEGDVAGRAPTNSEGVARIEFKPPKAGDYEFTVRLAKDSDRKAVSAPLTLCVRRREQEFIITDVDHTISDAGSLEFVRTKLKDIKPVKDSAKILRKLSKRYTIIYLTGREDIFRRKTKIWLEEKDFPVGPVFFWNVQEGEWSHEKYKTHLIAKLKRDWPNIRAGFGDLPGDAYAYMTNGLRIYIVRPEKKDEEAERAEFPGGVTFIESWKDEGMQKELLPEDD
jgi:hypothetical protein